MHQQTRRRYNIACMIGLQITTSKLYLHLLYVHRFHNSLFLHQYCFMILIDIGITSFLQIAFGVLQRRNITVRWSTYVRLWLYVCGGTLKIFQLSHPETQPSKKSVPGGGWDTLWYSTVKGTKGGHNREKGLCKMLSLGSTRRQIHHHPRQSKLREAHMKSDLHNRSKKDYEKLSPPYCQVRYSIFTGPYY